MNPFELQAELARQWLGLVSATAASATNAWLDLGQQSMRLWGANGSIPALQPRASLPSLPSLPGFAAGWPAPASPGWSAWPFAPMMFVPAPAWPWSLASAAPAAPWLWASPWSVLGVGFPGPLAAWQPAPPSPSDLFEQVASAYRSASGHAVAAILAPLAVASPPARNYGAAWWWRPMLGR